MRGGLGVVSYRAGVAPGTGRAVAAASPDPRDRTARSFTQNQIRLEALARFFIDLRRALGFTVPQAALAALTTAEVIEALETATLPALPSWPETARVVTAYTALAGIDARAVLTVLADVIEPREAPRADGRPARRPLTIEARPNAARQSQRRPGLRGQALAENAKRLRREAVHRMRERPDRAFYAVSLPLGLVLVLLNTSALAGIAKPIRGATQWLSASVSVIFPTMKDGMRLIETEDPRSRRADKLPIKGRSD